MYAQFLRAAGRDFRLRKPVVHFALIEHMAEAIDVSVRHPVVRDLECVGAGKASVVGASAIHGVNEGRAVVIGLFLFDIMGKRN